MILKPDETPTIYVDVDGTLVFWPGPDPGEAPIPWHPSLAPSSRHPWPAINQPLVDRLNAWYRPHSRCLVVWSRAGALHARQVAQYCGLTAHAYLPKPRMAIDDKPRTVQAGDPKGFEVIGPNDFDKVPA